MRTVHMKRLFVILLLDVLLLGMTGCDLGKKTVYLPKTYQNSAQKMEFSYDENGRLASFRINDRVLSAAYDESGRVLTMITSDDIAFNYVFTYTEDGQLLKKENHRKDGTGVTPVCLWTYDAKGRPLTQENFERTDKTRINYFYNGNGQLARNEHYKNDKLQYIEEYTYSSQGRLISQTRYLPDGDIYYLIDYDYNGLTVTATQTNAKGMNDIGQISDVVGVVSKRIYTYDEAGNLTGFDYNGDGTADEVYTWQAVKVGKDYCRQYMSAVLFNEAFYSRPLNFLDGSVTSPIN